MPDPLPYLGTCPACERRLKAERAAVVQKTRRATLVATDCEACSASLLLTIITTGEVKNPEHASTPTLVIGMVTDLTAPDAKKLLKEPPLTLEDVLALHRHFKRTTALRSK